MPLYDDQTGLDSIEQFIGPASDDDYVGYSNETIALRQAIRAALDEQRQARRQERAQTSEVTADPQENPLAQGRRMAIAANIDTAPDQQFISWPQFMADVGFDGLTSDGQQTEYDYYRDHVIPRYSADDKEAAGYQNEFDSKVRRPLAQRDKGDARQWIEGMFGETAGRTAAMAGDTVTDFGRGANAFGRSVVGLSRLLALDLVVPESAKALDNVLKSNSNSLDSALSPERQRGMKETGREDTLVGKLGALANNPASILGGAAESLPLMAGGEVVALGRILMGGTKLAAATAKQFLGASAIGETVITAGSVADDIYHADPSSRLKMYLGIPAGVVTGAVARGVGGYEARALAQFGKNKTAFVGDPAEGLAKSLGKNFVKEGLVEEGVQSVNETIFTNLGTGKPWDAGLGGAYVEGAVVGGFAGAGLGASFRNRGGASGAPGAPGAAAPPGNASGISQEDFDGLQARMAQDHQIVSDVVDSALDTNPLKDAAPTPMADPADGLTDRLVQLAKKSTKQQNYFWQLGAAIETAPEAERAQAYSDVLGQIETRLEKEQDASMYDRLKTVKEAIIEAQQSDPVVQNATVQNQQQQPQINDVHSVSDLLNTALARNPAAVNALDTSTTGDLGTFGSQLIDIINQSPELKPTSQAAATATPAELNPMLQVERPDEAVSHARAQTTDSTRRQIMDQLFTTSPDAGTIIDQYHAALQQNGITDTTLRPAEMQRLQRYTEISDALSKASLEERIHSSDPAENSGMEALIGEVATGQNLGPAAAVSNAEYTAGLSPEQVGFIKSVIREAVVRGVSVSRARDELLQTFDMTGDPRLQALSSVDFSRVYKLAQMSRAASKQIASQRRGPSSAPISSQDGTETQMSETRLSQEAQDAVPDAPAQPAMTQKQARNKITAKLIETGLYKHAGGVEDMRDDVKMLMATLDLDAVGDSYLAADVQDVIDNWPDYLGSASPELAMFDAGVQVYDPIYRTLPLMTVERTSNPIEGFSREHQSVVRTVMDYAASLLPKGAFDAVGKITPLTGASKFMSFRLGDRSISISASKIQSLIDRGGRSDDMRTMVGTMLHEMGHALDLAADGGLKSKYMAELGVGYEDIKYTEAGVEKTEKVVVPLGAIAKQLHAAWNTGEDEGHFTYPFSDIVYVNDNGLVVTRSVGVMQAELFAQINALYFGNSNLLSRISPAATQMMENIYGNAADFVEAEARVRGQVSYEHSRGIDPRADEALYSAPDSNPPQSTRVGHPGGLGERPLTGRAAVAAEAMKNNVRQTADGKYIGAPENAQTEKQVKKLLATLDKLLDHRFAMWSTSKDWYPASHDAVMNMYPNDPAKQDLVFRLLAIYSQANSLGANVTAVVKSMADIAAGEIPARGRFPYKTMKLLPVMMKALSLDKTVKGVNDKIESFYRNLKFARDTTGPLSRESTIDRWMLRMFGYSDLDARTKKANGTSERDAPTASPVEYVFSRALMDRLAAMRTDKSGEMILPHQVQAALWTYIKNYDQSIKWAAEKQELEAEQRSLSVFVKANKKFLSEGFKLVPGMSDDVARVVALNKRLNVVERALSGKYAEFNPAYMDYSDYFVRSTSTSTMEMIPHPDTGVLANLGKLPSDVQLLYAMAARDVLLDEQGNDRVMEAIFGGQGLDGQAKSIITGLNREFEVGTFEGVVSHNDTAQLFLAKNDANKMPDDKMHAYVSMLGYIYNQAASAWHRIDPKGKTHGVVLKFPSSPNLQQITDLYALIRAELPGADLSKVGTELRALNFTGATNEEFNNAINRAVEKFEGSDFIIQREQKFVTGYIPNDWRRFKNGEVYLDQITKLGDPNLVALARELRADADANNREFAGQFPDAGTAEFSPRREPTGAEPQGVLFHPGAAGAVTGFNGTDTAFYAAMTNPAAQEYTVYIANSGSLRDPANKTNLTMHRNQSYSQMMALYKQGGYSRQVRVKASGAPLVAPPNAPNSTLVDLMQITDTAAKESNKLFGAGSKSALFTRSFARTLIDTEEALERLENMLREQDPNLADEFRLFSQSETLRAGVNERTEREKRQYADPFIDKLKELKEKGIQIADVDSYIWSLVTPYRNGVIALRTTNEVKDGAGQTNAAAMQTIRDFEAKGWGQELQTAAGLYFKMMNRQLEIDAEFGNISSAEKLSMENSYSTRDLHSEQAAGLLTLADRVEAEARGWDQPRAIPYYAPMKTYTDLAYEIPQSTSGAGSKKFALGRASKPDSPSVFGFQQFYTSIAKGAQNRFKQNIMQTALTFADAGFWTVDEITPVKYLDQTTGLIRFGIDSSHKMSESVVTLRVDGKVHTIHFKAPEFAKILSNKAWSPAQRGLIAQGIINMSGVTMRLMSMTHTALNPDFWVVNAPRDAAGVLLNAPPEVQKKFAAQYVREMLNTETWNESSKFAWSDTSLGKQRYDNTNAAWNEFAAAGGKVSYENYLVGFEAQQEGLNRLVNPSAVERGVDIARDGMNLFTGIGETLDNGIRFAAYKAARSAGFTPLQAASVAKNSTVNFERKGSAHLLGRAYMFFGATVQGTYNTGRAIARSPVTQGASVGLFLMGLIAGMIGHTTGGDDDDETKYGKIPDYARNKKLIWTPNGAAIPLPQGFSFLYALGNSIADSIWSKRPDKGRRAVLRAVQAFTGAFLPNDPPKADSFAGYVTALVTPELLKPVTSVATNKDVFGHAIIPKNDLKESMPRYLQGAGKASEWSKDISQAVHSMANVDISPAAIDYIAKTLSGSVGTFTRHVANNDSQANPSAIPLVGKFISPGPNDYELKNDVEGAIADLIGGANISSAQLSALMQANPKMTTEKAMIQLLKQKDPPAGFLAEEMRHALGRKVQVQGLKPTDPEFKRRYEEGNARLRQVMARYNAFKPGG